MMFLDTTGTSQIKNAVESIDFGGFKVAVTSSFNSDNTVKSISRLVIGPVNGKINNAEQTVRADIHQFAYNTRNLEYIQISGEYTGTSSQKPIYDSSCRVVDFSGLSGAYNISGLETAERIDIRGMSLNGITTFNGFLNFCDIGILIIGNLDTSTLTEASVMPNNGHINKLVCVSATPPATNQDGILLSSLLNKAESILVSEGNVTIDDVTTTILEAYQSAPIWSNYSSKMSTYPEGEY